MSSMMIKLNSYRSMVSGLKVYTHGAVPYMKIKNLSSDNAKTLWEWKGQKEFDEVKQAIIADRKKFRNGPTVQPVASYLSVTSRGCNCPYLTSLTTMTLPPSQSNQTQSRVCVINLFITCLLSPNKLDF